MSDFKKESPRDDSAIVPSVFAIATDVPAVETDQNEDDKETTKQAAPYWHPAWAAVEDRFNELLKTYGDPANATLYKDLPADEFKIRMLAEAVVHSELEKIMEDVKRAVESVESRPKPAERAKQTGA